MTKVSIIIPVYNMGKYLQECLDSIFNQTLTGIEVICIDDGSTDNSLTILDRYKTKHANMVIASQKNAGSGSARNLGIGLSKGKYLMFVDPDDYLVEIDVIQLLYNTAQKYQVEVCGGCILWNRNGFFLENVNEVLTKGGVAKEGMFCFEECQRAANGHQRYIIEKKLLIKNKIFYPDYRRGQDTLFITKVLNAANKFYLIKKNVYGYRVDYKEELFTIQKAEDYMNALLDVLKLAIDNELEDLFDYRIATINSVAKDIWYKLLVKNNEWNKNIKINEVIKKGNKFFEYDEDANCLMDRNSYFQYIKLLEEEWCRAEEEIKKYGKIIIYGAGKSGKKICSFLIGKGYEPSYFVVSDTRINEKVINRIKIISLDELYDKKDYLYILAVIDLPSRKEMKKHLLKRGCEHIIEFNPDITMYMDLV